MLRSIFDSGLSLRCDKWDSYFEVYEEYLSKFVNKSPVVVEIGVAGGGSLEMWKKYFGNWTHWMWQNISRTNSCICT